MKKYLFFFVAGVLGLYSCTVLEPEKIEPQLGTNSISIPLVSEDVSIDPATKAYLNETASDWSYVWEDGDQLGFFQYRRGMLRYQGVAEVDKRPSSVNVVYDSDFRVDDVIYSYLYQPDAEAEYGVVNDDPSELYFTIPTWQVTSSDPEVFDYSIDHSFRISNIAIDGTRSYTVSGTDAVGSVPRDATVKFKILGYNSDLLYRTSSNTSDLHIDAFGNATLKVSFDPVPSITNKEGEVVSEVKVFVDGYESDCAKFSVKTAVNVTEPTFIGKILKRPGSTQYIYSIPPTGSAYERESVISYDVTEYGLVKPYPVRNCMPCVSKGTTVTSSLVNYPEDIQSSMTMYMLGSVAEFRCYSLDENIAVGETLQAVMFSSNDGECAGLCTYNILEEGLYLENLTDTDIIAYDEDGIELRYGRDNYASLYMVLAPGTYSATVSFITDQNVYTYEMASKPFSRATRKSIYCDFSAANCTVTPIDEF